VAKKENQDLTDFELETVKKVHQLQQKQLDLRERLRACNGTLKDAIQDLLNGISEGHQLKLKFGPIRDDETDAKDPPSADNLDAKAAKNK
jgi:hypothetical protein